MDNQINPSAGALKAYRLGLLFYFGALLSALPYTMLCEGFETLEGSAKYLIPILMGVGSIILMINGFSTSNQNAETAGWNNRMGVAGLLSLVFPISIYMTLSNSISENFEIILILFSLAFSIATIIIGYNFRQLPLYGASLASKGAYWIFAGLIIVFISQLLLKSTEHPSYSYSYYGDYHDAILSYRHKTAIFTTMIYVGATGIIGGIFALLFGAKIAVDGAKQIEEEQAEQPAQEQPVQEQPVQEQQPMVKGNFDDTTNGSDLSL